MHRVVAGRAGLRGFLRASGAFSELLFFFMAQARVALLEALPGMVALDASGVSLFRGEGQTADNGHHLWRGQGMHLDAIHRAGCYA
ncbi:hypothetical protein D3C73_1406500 [compost metagenome]